MARFGITSTKAYGVSVPTLRKIAKEIGTNREIAQQLWTTGILEARILAALVDNPVKVTERQMEQWVQEFDNWAVCDTCCGNLFDRTPFTWRKAIEWSKRKEEFVKRASFALMAWLAVHDKKADDKQFVKVFPLIKREATGERNFVKKAVNWALRQIGKRNLSLNDHAIRIAREIQKLNSSSAKWIASDALRELTGKAVQRRLSKKTKSRLR
ncbi:MAG: DNA alkylation repair protein [Ignavibacteriae bacterium]|nr:DNA alkylation repair protein [Ignavibacteriota bacterium]